MSATKNLKIPPTIARQPGLKSRNAPPKERTHLTAVIFGRGVSDMGSYVNFGTELRTELDIGPSSIEVTAWSAGPTR